MYALTDLNNERSFISWTLIICLLKLHTTISIFVFSVAVKIPKTSLSYFAHRHIAGSTNFVSGTHFVGVHNCWNGHGRRFQSFQLVNLPISGYQLIFFKKRISLLIKCKASSLLPVTDGATIVSKNTPVTEMDKTWGERFHRHGDIGESGRCSSVDPMSQLLRWTTCSSKPDKRLILIGKCL